MAMERHPTTLKEECWVEVEEMRGVCRCDCRQWSNCLRVMM